MVIGFRVFTAIRIESADEHSFSGNTEQMDRGISMKCKNNLLASCRAEHIGRVCDEHKMIRERAKTLLTSFGTLVNHLTSHFTRELFLVLIKIYKTQQCPCKTCFSGFFLIWWGFSESVAVIIQSELTSCSMVKLTKKRRKIVSRTCKRKVSRVACSTASCSEEKA